MNRKTVLALSLAAVFAITLTFSVAEASVSTPNWIIVNSASKSQVGNIAKLSATTNGEIPRNPDSFVKDNAVVGFAWADLDTGKIVVATIHPVLGRDSNQNPDSWHVHTATLVPGIGDSDFCVGSIDSTPESGITIQGNVIQLDINTAKLPVPVADIDGAVGFTINGNSACGSGLGVKLTGPAEPTP